MIVDQEGIKVKPKPMILSLEVIGAWVYIIVLFNLAAIAISVTDLNLLEKNTKDDYNRYHYLTKDSKMFLLIRKDYYPPAPTMASFIDTSWFLFVRY